VTFADLDLPTREQINAVKEKLSPEGAEMFAQEMFEALWQSKEHADGRPLQEVVGAWYATLLLLEKHGTLEGIGVVLAARRHE
jgi:hypothetical protein